MAVGSASRAYCVSVDRRERIDVLIAYALAVVLNHGHFLLTDMRLIDHPRANLAFL